MAKQVLVYNMMDEAELKQKLNNKNISYKQAMHSFENTILDLSTPERRPNMHTVKTIMTTTKEDLVIVFVRSFLPQGEIWI